MDREYSISLAKIRLLRAKELLEDSKRLLKSESYKSANNRSFYAIEKAIRALLIFEDVEPLTHNGVMKQFNYIFIYKNSGYFTQDDYQKVAKSEQIRNASDYDDFYIASKIETEQQIQDADYIIKKVENYINDKYLKG